MNRYSACVDLARYQLEYLGHPDAEGGGLGEEAADGNVTRCNEVNRQKRWSWKYNLYDEVRRAEEQLTMN